MVIAGLQKMTLLDFPGKVACTVFLHGCNFRCPFCHNSQLLFGTGEALMEKDELLDFLRKRVGLLDGVCITGGEPTLQPELPQLLREIKALGYPVKLDTNGSRPEVLKALAEEGLLDYVAMDIKNGPASYPETAGMRPDLLEKIEESMVFLMTGALDYEFRTTVVAEFHHEESIAAMGAWLQRLAPENKAKRFFLQNFVARDSVLQENLHAPAQEKLELFREILAPFAQTVEIRGVD